jgi:hypothetical protein
VHALVLGVDGVDRLHARRNSSGEICRRRSLSARRTNAWG